MSLNAISKHLKYFNANYVRQIVRPIQLHFIRVERFTWIPNDEKKTKMRVKFDLTK